MRSSRLHKLERLVTSLGVVSGHQSPGIVYFRQGWAPDEPAPEVDSVHLEWEPDALRPWPVRCSCGLVNCPEMQGVTYFMPPPMPPAPAPAAEGDEDDAAIREVNRLVAVATRLLEGRRSQTG
jgi:hypothetical protein